MAGRCEPAARHRGRRIPILSIITQKKGRLLFTSNRPEHLDETRLNYLANLRRKVRTNGNPRPNKTSDAGKGTGTGAPNTATVAS